MENAPADPALTISSPAQLSCGVLAFPVRSVKTQKASFQSPKKPRTGAAPGHPRPWVSFQRISGWMRETVACGQSGERAFRCFRFLGWLICSDSAVPALDVYSQAAGNKSLACKKRPPHLLLCRFHSGPLSAFHGKSLPPSSAPLPHPRLARKSETVAHKCWNKWQISPVLKRGDIYWLTDLKLPEGSDFRCGWIQTLHTVLLSVTPSKTEVYAQALPWLRQGGSGIHPASLAAPVERQHPL